MRSAQRNLNSLLAQLISLNDRWTALCNDRKRSLADRTQECDAYQLMARDPNGLLHMIHDIKMLLDAIHNYLDDVKDILPPTTTNSTPTTPSRTQTVTRVP
ncbi:unnamed protein product [Anisakis simplex]|uniref:Uncharacterized protein n=1 Tax=Anisakis simplex TaxID=6269 RepID=A0A3P6NDF4_ANISI|nr:unnamed protein product [Anisakis simplex]